MSYSIGFVVNYKVREKINVFNAMVDCLLIDKMNHSELEEYNGSGFFSKMFESERETSKQILMPKKKDIFG